MSIAYKDVPVVDTMPDLVENVMAKVDDPEFETWKSETIRGASLAILQTKNGVVLHVAADRGRETQPPYVASVFRKRRFDIQRGP
ncbi:hypothetical protein E0Z10_g8120 [Xylaria hypoxylon]|uniref:Uncharacterized protein n=1 Tax=Xylaria hypoxylon TaxID=37992 RepID=A0A4Z0YW53_9PEZI|nr:hypothetical protein E0Z10_g8120 [Xylaria hypoxylon]